MVTGSPRGSFLAFAPSAVSRATAEQMSRRRARPGGDAALFDGLERCFGERLLRPADPGYDAARRVWNGAIDRRPGAIACCEDPGDVVAAVRFARERELEVGVRSGGHGVAGHAVCDGGLVIDLSAMKRVSVDPVRRTARAEAGVLWGELDDATQRSGLVTVGGIVSHTGIAGLTLGGGIGWLMRKHGATVDNLISVELVTADGERLVASEQENPELFWGLRGGGGNFGVATSFTYRLHPVGPIVLAGPIFYPLERARELLRFYREFAAVAPDELTTIFTLRQAPALPFLPEEVCGRPIVMIAACYAAAPEDGVRVVEPLKAFGRPIIDLLQPRPYLELQAMFDSSVPHGWHYHWKSVELPPLTDDAIDALVEHAARITSPKSYCIVFQLGGALARVGHDRTAFSQRETGHNVNINAVWTGQDPDRERHIAWARDYWDAIRPHARARVYVNFLDHDEAPERAREAYGPHAYTRLVDLKRAYDPTNLFHRNHNIQPS